MISMAQTPQALGKLAHGSFNAPEENITFSMTPKLKHCKTCVLEGSTMEAGGGGWALLGTSQNNDLEF